MIAIEGKEANVKLTKNDISSYADYQFELAIKNEIVVIFTFEQVKFNPRSMQNLSLQVWSK